MRWLLPRKSCFGHLDSSSANFAKISNKCLKGQNNDTFMFDIRKVKGQPHCDVAMFCRSTFLAIIQTVTQVQKGGLWAYFTVGRILNFGDTNLETCADLLRPRRHCDDLHFAKNYTRYLLLNFFSVFTPCIVWDWRGKDVNCNPAGARRQTRRRYFQFVLYLLHHSATCWFLTRNHVCTVFNSQQLFDIDNANVLAQQQLFGVLFMRPINANYWIIIKLYPVNAIKNCGLHNQNNKLKVSATAVIFCGFITTVTPLLAVVCDPLLM